MERQHEGSGKDNVIKAVRTDAGGEYTGVTGAPYREVNSKVATAPKLKVEDKDRVNNSRRIKKVKLNSVKLKASLNKFSRGKVGYRSRMPNA